MSEDIVYNPKPYIPRVPTRYADVAWEDVPENIQTSFEQIPKTLRGLYIHGGVGVGKTHIAYALYRNATQKARIIIEEKQPYGGINYEEARPGFWNTTDLLREIRLDFDRTREQKEFVEETLMSHKGILFLDDIGSEKLSDWVKETFYLIVNRRYNEKLPVVFTSNHSIKELANHVGSRIASRIVEMCEIIPIVGEDRRIRR